MADGGGPPAAAQASGLTVAYGGVVALDAVDLTVPAGSAVAVLGPSGAGKSSLLHAMAGFVAPAAGEVRLAGEVVADRRRCRPPEQRSVAVVFQHYALWPHLSALNTVAYPLRRRGVPAARAREQAGELLELMGLAGLADRRPSQLSGGQQQRVGLARALAREPALHLFDEPTAHLDAGLRATLAHELSQRRLESGAAALHATHDAAEALSVADRVALVRDGRLVQLGTPREVYEQPVDRWAAQLTGPASLLPQAARGPDRGSARLQVGEAEAAVRADASGGSRADRLDALLRPEWVQLGGSLPGVVAAVAYRGPHTDYRLDTPAGTVEAREPGPPRAAMGEATGWSAERAWLLEPAGTEAEAPTDAATPTP